MAWSSSAYFLLSPLARAGAGVTLYVDNGATPGHGGGLERATGRGLPGAGQGLSIFRGGVGKGISACFDGKQHRLQQQKLNTAVFQRRPPRPCPAHGRRPVDVAALERARRGGRRGPARRAHDAALLLLAAF